MGSCRRLGGVSAASGHDGRATESFWLLRVQLDDQLLLDGSSDFAALVTADAAARMGMEHGLQKVVVFVKGPGSGRETAIRSLQAAGLDVTGVKDVTPQAHNGCRPRKRRRV